MLMQEKNKDLPVKLETSAFVVLPSFLGSLCEVAPSELSGSLEHSNSGNDCGSYTDCGSRMPLDIY